MNEFVSWPGFEKKGGKGDKIHETKGSWMVMVSRINSLRDTAIYTLKPR